jgi:hypothetical protein
MVNNLPIWPSTKIHALLERYPELENVLVELAPPFKKLRNPFLRKGIARVASLKQAAAVGGMPVNDLVNHLRSVVGQEPVTCEDVSPHETYYSDEPPWFAEAKIVNTIDERDSDRDKMPIAAVLQKGAQLQPGEVLELITTFLPAPGIDIIKAKGLRVWSVQESPELIRTYICKLGHGVD